MNFLKRAAAPVLSPDPAVGSALPPHPAAAAAASAAPTLQGLISEELSRENSLSDYGDQEEEEDDGSAATESSSNVVNEDSVGQHWDVDDDEGCITIPCGKLEENWSAAPDIRSLRHLDRSFLFPGERLHILVCLAAPKKGTEVITPFKVAAAMFKKKEDPQIVNGDHWHFDEKLTGKGDTISNMIKANGLNSGVDIAATKSLIRMENHRQQSELLLQGLQNSHFIVRVAESDETLWCKRINTDLGDDRAMHRCLPATIDCGTFDGNVSGGMARNIIGSFVLHNGDIVVLLEVHVECNNLKDPVLEIVQFEKHFGDNPSSESTQSLKTHADPCNETLKWLLPLDQPLLPLPRPSLPPPVSVSATGNASQRSMSPPSAGSQRFSFGHFRSYSMSSLPQTSTPLPSAVPSLEVKPIFNHEYFKNYSPNKPMKNQSATKGLLSFRGISLERERFSVQCGLGGIYLPGKRWKRKIQIIHPIDIHCFATDCNGEDIICIQVKNVSPQCTPDVIIFVDSVSIVFDKVPINGPPSSLPVLCVEAGNGHNLPDLALRRGEEHSFILKPGDLKAMDLKGCSDRSVPSRMGDSGQNMLIAPQVADHEQYAVLVSCRCNCTESKLLFRKPINWHPRSPRDLIISVASEISEQISRPKAKKWQLPVQELILQASNLTNEDLNLTVLAPTTFITRPSVISLSSAPVTPVSTLDGLSEFKRALEDKNTVTEHGFCLANTSDYHNDVDNGESREFSSREHSCPVQDAVPNSQSDCTHLWLQSTVPLGCVAAQSSATVKLELLPLTDGIITLDTIQIAIKEKDLKYIPEHCLKIHATTSVASGII